MNRFHPFLSCASDVKELMDFPWQSSSSEPSGAPFGPFTYARRDCLTRQPGCMRSTWPRYLKRLRRMAQKRLKTGLVAVFLYESLEIICRQRELKTLIFCCTLLVRVPASHAWVKVVLTTDLYIRLSCQTEFCMRYIQPMFYICKIFLVALSLASEVYECMDIFYFLFLNVHMQAQVFRSFEVCELNNFVC